MNDSKSNILLFDGVCNLCNYLVTFIINRDINRKFKFTSLQSDKGQAILKHFGLPVNDFESLVYICNDKYFIKSTATLHVLKDLGGLWKLAYVFIIIPHILRDFVYTMLAKSRHRIFGKQNVCLLPSNDIKSRFI